MYKIYHARAADIGGGELVWLLFNLYSNYTICFFFFPISFRNNIITSVLFIIIETGYCIILLSFALYWKQRKFYLVHDDLICIASSRLCPFRNNDDANFCGLVAHGPGATGRCIGGGQCVCGLTFGKSEKNNRDKGSVVFLVISRTYLKKNIFFRSL